jgi:hypothetical protein
MRTRNLLLLGLAAVAAVGLVAVVPSGAQTSDDLPTFQHAVKFICGDAGGTSDNSQPVLLGTYDTAINIHNPNFAIVRGNASDPGGPSTSASFSPTFRKKAVVLFPQLVGGEIRELTEFPQGPLPWFRPAQLRPDWGFEIDCRDIRDVLMDDTDPVTEGPQPDPRAERGLIKGYVVIEAKGRLPLDVTVAYTTIDDDLKATTVDVETVEPKKIRSG